MKYSNHLAMVKIAEQATTLLKQEECTPVRPSAALADEVATYLQTEREQSARKARIMTTARAQARARGEWGVIDFHRILHGSAKP
jgi:hypothetical protein